MLTNPTLNTTTSWEPSRTDFDIYTVAFLLYFNFNLIVYYLHNFFPLSLSHSRVCFIAFKQIQIMFTALRNLYNTFFCLAMRFILEKIIAIRMLRFF